MGNINNDEMKNAKKRGFVFVGMSLIDAVWMNDVVSVKALIASGADLEEKDVFGSTPLSVAAWRGFVECAKVLLEAKADLKAKGFGEQPLYAASFHGHVDCVKVRRGWSSSYGWQFCNVSPSSALHRVQGKCQLTRRLWICTVAVCSVSWTS